MKKETANKIGIAIFLLSSFLISHVLNGIFWNIMGVAFLIAGTYGIICEFRKVKFLF